MLPTITFSTEATSDTLVSVLYGWVVALTLADGRTVTGEVVRLDDDTDSIIIRLDNGSFRLVGPVFQLTKVEVL